MAELKSAEYYMKKWGCSGTPSQWPGILQKIHEEVAQACADASVESLGGLASHDLDDAPGIVHCRAAILAVAKPEETLLDRLGRVLWNAQYPNGPWDPVPEMVKKQFCDRAAAVQAELAKIEEEARGE